MKIGNGSRWAFFLLGLTITGGMGFPLSAPAQQAEDNYQAPDFEALPFSADAIEIAAAEKEKLTGALVAAARNFELSPRRKAQAVAIVLKIDPLNREAFVTNFQLTRGGKPKPVAGFEKLTEAAAVIFSAAQTLDRKKPDAARLRGYLIDLAAQFDPDNPDAAFEKTVIESSGEKIAWAAVFGETPEPSTSTPAPAGTAAKTTAMRGKPGAVTTAVATAASSSSAPGSPATGSDGKLAKTQALIKGLLVQQVEGNNFAGKASQMNATAVPLKSATELKTTFNQPVGNMMTSALNEVIKHLRVRHGGKLPGQYKVEIAFEEQYIDKDGPSAAVACGLLLESLVSGFEIDPNFAVTGDMNADGSVQPVGGVDAKIRGAAKRDCNIVAIPKENERVISDLLIVSGPRELAKIQIFRLEKFDQALALATRHENRPENLRTAIDHFTEVQKVLERPNGMSLLKNQHVVKRLRTVVELAPNHLSARYLLLKALDREPDKLSLMGSLQGIDRAAAPLIRAIRQGKFEARESSLDSDEYGDAASNLRRIRTKLDKRTWKCADAILVYAKLMRTWVNDRPTSSTKIIKLVEEIQAAGQQVSREYDTLENRPDVREEMMR